VDRRRNDRVAGPTTDANGFRRANLGWVENDDFYVVERQIVGRRRRLDANVRGLRADA
jgi:hypothetical protein